ncbi:MAG TPA: hypothetical protein PK479_07910 [Novosphingobium sp.]|nr:hypothetical protein [Novosphingobium sp.]HNN54854.1 hypothetical protein [Novosphingobium sp.]
MGQSLFRSIPWWWVLVWLCLPFLAVMLMWPIGGPPMGRFWLGFGLAGLVAAQLPWLAARRLVLVVLMLAVPLVFLGNTFNISLYNYDLLLPFLREVRPLRSPEYLIGGGVVAGAGALAWRLAPRVPHPREPRVAALGLLAVLCMANVDNMVTASTAGSYQGVPQPDAPFGSAVQRAGVASPRSDGRHLVIILVEALGNVTSPAERALFEADWNRPEWRQRYDVRHGTSPYYGSTTSGELRELCGVWGDYSQFDFSAADCLPAQYAKAGYKTAGWHSFTGAYFDRAQWWPGTGFAETGFAEDLVALGARRCGGVFPGVCDHDVPALIGTRLKQADQPQLVYWLTLNSHLPLLEHESLGTSDCRYGGTVLADAPPMLCRLFQVHHNLSEAITAMALDPELPPTDILIVGDHMPPFFQRDARVRFDGDTVPWILLRAR